MSKGFETYAPFVFELADKLDKSKYQAMPNTAFRRSTLKNKDLISQVHFISWWIFYNVWVLGNETSFQRVAYLFEQSPYGAPDKLNCYWIWDQYERYLDEKKEEEKKEAVHNALKFWQSN